MPRKSSKRKEIQSDEFQYIFHGVGLTDSEKRVGKRQFKAYRTNFHIDSLSDLHLLEELVFRETLQVRYKKEIFEYHDNRRVKENSKSPIVPSHMLKALDDNLNQVVMLKEKLGLFKAKGAKDPYKHLQMLKRKFEKWGEENQGSRTFPCPHCTKMIMLKIRADIWEAQKHTFFKDKILANKKLWKLYKDGKITRHEVAQVLGTADDYCEWLEKHIFPQDK